jgi:hypothetical protein
MSNQWLVDRLNEHIGHKVVISPYAGACVTLECEDCSHVIVDEDTLLMREPQGPTLQPPDTNVLLLGNLVDGIRFIGPFPDFDSASDYGDEFPMTQSWIATLEAPRTEGTPT